MDRTQDAIENEPLSGADKPEQNFSGRARKFKKSITVEPVALLVLTASVLSAISSQTLNIEKICRVNLAFGDDVCDALRRQDSKNYTEYEKSVQAFLTKQMAWRSIVQTVVPCMILPFVGAWSDRTGRRIIVFVIPIIGEVLQCLSNIVNVVFFYQLPVQVTIFFDAFFPAITGGWCVIFLGLLSYISDLTTADNRTHRLGYVHFCTYVGIPIGLAISGILLKSYGYYAVYGTSLSLHLINLTYIHFVLEDPTRTEEQITKHDNKGIGHFFKTFFDLKNIKETVRVVFKNGPNRRRLRMCILLSVVSILFGPMYGEMSIMYISTRYRFNWDEVKFSMFQTYNFITHTIGTVFSITVFSKYLKFHDSILGIISTVSKIAGSFFYCFAPNETILFLAPLVEILNGTSLLAMRSIVSKFVAADELGKVNSIFGLTENLMPLIYVPLYTTVYSATMETLPGAVFLMGASMTLPAVFVFIWLLCEHRKQTAKSRYADKNTPLGSGNDAELKVFYPE